MYYVCIEDNKVCSVLSYEPNTPPSVTVYTISNEDYALLNDGRHYFNTESNQIELLPADVLLEKDHHENTANQREFLVSTDWKVLRHIRETALGLPTSMTNEEYIALEQQRQDTAKSI